MTGTWIVARLGARALAMVALAGALATAGCTQRDAQVVAAAPVTDPYVDTGDGGARYTGDVTARNSAGVLPGMPSQQTFASSAGTTVVFPQDQVVLTAEAQAIVARQAEWLAANGDFRATIEGHADEQGTREYNLALGARRAASVQEYMVARGIEPGRISTVSYGNERLLEACTDDEACFARNRRAVTVVTPGAAGV